MHTLIVISDTTSELHDNITYNFSMRFCFMFQSKYERDLILVMICLAICVPNVLTFLESLLKSVFSNKAWPTFSTIFVVS